VPETRRVEVGDDEIGVADGAKSMRLNPGQAAERTGRHTAHTTEYGGLDDSCTTPTVRHWHMWRVGQIIFFR